MSEPMKKTDDRGRVRWQPRLDNGKSLYWMNPDGNGPYYFWSHTDDRGKAVLYRSKGVARWRGGTTERSRRSTRRQNRKDRDWIRRTT